MSLAQEELFAEESLAGRGDSGDTRGVGTAGTHRAWGQQGHTGYGDTGNCENSERQTGMGAAPAGPELAPGPRACCSPTVPCAGAAQVCLAAGRGLMCTDVCDGGFRVSWDKEMSADGWGCAAGRRNVGDTPGAARWILWEILVSVLEDPFGIAAASWDLSPCVCD